MTALTATPAMLAAHRGKGVSDFMRAVSAYPDRLKRKQAKVKGKSTVPAVPFVDNSPTPERIAQADGAIIKTDAPPFTSVVEGNLGRYRKFLGQDAHLALSAFHELAMDALKPARVTASYDGVSVDQSKFDFQHISDKQRRAHQDFHRIWASLDEPTQRLIAELILEIPLRGERVREVSDIAHELSGYTDSRRAAGAIPAVLRVLSWRLTDLMGGRIPVRA